MRLAHIRSDLPGEMNRTLSALAEAMLADGARVVGAVQVDGNPGGDTPGDMDLQVLPDGPRICISQSLGSGSGGCRLNPERLEEVVQECSVRLAQGADLLIVNKFGGHEADGRGFRELIATALSEGVPVVIGVTAEKLSDYESFAGDLAEEVACDLAALRAWCAA
ncbi:MAG: DUF2478 domain-containing protein [Tropicimonas sp.]|uniref:DUF2478 domain-containing protein n=1 Tax=Tropicimonas sp. TaxID=2067044 RepID=UPI003A87C0DE